MKNLKDKKTLHESILSGRGLDTTWSYQDSFELVQNEYYTKKFNKNLIGIAFSECDVKEDSPIFESLADKTQINANSWFAINSANRGFESVNNILSLADYFAWVLNNKQESYLNYSYMKEQLSNPEFYKDKSGLFFFKDPERIDKRDFSFMEFQKYALTQKIPVAMNYLYKDIIANKENYHDYFVKEGTKEQIETLLNHFLNKKINYPTKDDEKLKNIERYFYSPAFVLEFAKLPELNDNQKEIVSFILNSSKLVEKITEQSGKNGLYNKGTYAQKESKDIFINAFHANNTDFIDILIAKNYSLNENEITYLLEKNMTSQLPSLNLEISQDDTILKKLQSLIFKDNIASIASFTQPASSIKLMTDEEISILKKEHNSIVHDYKFNLLFTEGQNPGFFDEQKMKKLYNGKEISLIEFLMLSTPVEIRHVKKQGISLNNNLEIFVWDTLIKSPLEKGFSIQNSATEDLSNLQRYFKDFLDNNSVYENVVFIEKAMSYSMSRVDQIETINFLLEPILIKKIDEYLDKGVLDDSFIKKYCTHNLFIYNNADTSILDDYLKEDKDEIGRRLANVYFDNLPVNYNVPQANELAKVIHKNPSFMESVQEKRSSFGHLHLPEKLQKIEKALFVFKAQEERDILMENSGIQDMQPSHSKKRL